MPVLDAVFVGKIYLPEVSQGPIQPPSGSPPGIWGGGNVPMPTPPIPIYPGGTPNPPGIWGGGNVPMPTPPIFMPPGIWGGGNVPMPTPPIPIYPGGTPNPPGIWGGGNVPMPTPPIFMPPGGSGGGGAGGSPSHPINNPPTDNPNWIMVFIPGVGWVWGIVPGVAGGKPETPPSEGEEENP